MKSIRVSTGRLLPPPAFKEMADRIFLIALLCLTLGSYFLDLKEGFISAVAALSLYLGSLGIRRRILILRALYTSLLSLISIFLAALDPLHLLAALPIYTLSLVFFERDEYHRGVPMFFLPLALLFFSLDLPPGLILERWISVSAGITAGLIAGLFIWPPQEASMEEKTSSPLEGRVSLKKIYPYLISKATHLNRLKIRYFLRKSIALTLILLTGFFWGNEYAEGGALLFLILHTSIDHSILPKTIKRLAGTILGGILYLPLEHLIKSRSMVFILAVAALYLGFLFLQHCYSAAAAFLTLNLLLFSAGSIPFEAAIVQRLIFVVLGGGTAVLISHLMPIKEDQGLFKVN